MRAAPSTSSQKILHAVHRYGEEELETLARDAALRAVRVLNEKPDAVIVVATGQEMEGFYKALVQIFQEDSGLDLSNASFFLMDEYEGFEGAHPLSNAYFFKKHFLEPLRHINEARAPRDDACFYPGQKRSEAKVDAAFWQDFLTSKGRAVPDLVVLTFGAAYPVRDALGTLSIKGGRVGAVEPGTTPTEEIVQVTLSEHRKGELAHRYKALARLIDAHEMPPVEKGALDVPNKAWSFAPMSFAGATTLLVLATGEDKGPVVAHVLENEASLDMPASFLSHLAQVSWYVDAGAVGQLTTTAWQNGVLSTEQMTEALCQASTSCRGIPLMLEQHFPDKTVACDRAMLQKAHEDLKESLASCLTTDTWPEGKRILVLSPHPDDDVISMGAALVRLKEMGNTVHILYAVTGSNAVRESLPSYADAYLQVTNFLPGGVEKKKSVAAKALVREWEAAKATGLLGVPTQNLIFFKADYYERRGIPGLSPFSAHDILRMKTLLKDLAPEIIFFAAENDPNGAHGLSTQLLATALDALVQSKELSPPVLYGYRGAYNEWPLNDPSSLLVLPYDAAL
jgi:glucosamine-6-phosphate deaminase